MGLISNCALDVAIFAAGSMFLAACTKAPERDELGDLYKRDASEGIYDITPVRGERNPLFLHRDGDAYECTMCHDAFTGEFQELTLVGEHQDITFDHGRNVYCMNCHNSQNPDAFIGYQGEEIPGNEPTQLCAKCHGPHIREWELGVHGRVNLYWHAEWGEQKKLACIQCHDPHRPNFQRMKPDPPPVFTRFDSRSQKEPPDAG